MSIYPVFNDVITNYRSVILTARLVPGLWKWLKVEEKASFDRIRYTLYRKILWYIRKIYLFPKLTRLWINSSNSCVAMSIQDYYSNNLASNLNVQIHASVCLAGQVVLSKLRLQLRLHDCTSFTWLLHRRGASCACRALICMVDYTWNLVSVLLVC